MLYPMFALVLMTFLVAARLLYLRVRAVKAGEVKVSEFRLNRGSAVSDVMAQASRNYSNLFEVPVLFYAAGSIAIALGLDGPAMVVLAWLFVAARAVHSWIHLTFNNVVTRLQAFMVGNILVLAMWVTLLVGYAQRA